MPVKKEEEPSVGRRLSFGQFENLCAPAVEFDAHLTLWRTGQCFRWISRADNPPHLDDAGRESRCALSLPVATDNVLSSDDEEREIEAWERQWDEIGCELVGVASFGSMPPPHV